MEQKKFAQDLIDFIYESPTSFQAVETSKKLLIENDFKELLLDEKWNIEVNGKYYITKNSSAIIAFVVNSKNTEQEGFRIIGSHSDSPTFRIKPKAEISVENTYLKLNTECYGGPILNTWLDRPLGIAGRVVLRSNNILKPIEKMVNINKPVCIIPNVAIHMNRTVNEGYALNKQKDMLP
ncbi:MAG TPA: M18 family aminopeptidase, partial [Romboutsia sp.]|nr:M18 family aminopeptidase [Romboutsia sp.]